MDVPKNRIVADFMNVMKDIPTGAPLLFHTDIASMGLIEEFKNRASMAQNYEDLMDEVSGGRPYLIPTFNYDYCQTGVFDLAKDFGKVGALSKYYSKKYPHLRTRTPVFNFVIKNNGSVFSLAPVVKCYGYGSTFDTLRKCGGYVIIIGNLSNTFAHHAEETLPVGYRYSKRFTGKVLWEGKAEDTELEFRVRPRGGAVIYSEMDITDAIGEGIMRKSNCGPTTMIWYKASEYFDFIQRKLKQDELYMLDESSKKAIQTLWSRHGKPLSLQKYES